MKRFGSYVVTREGRVYSLFNRWGYRKHPKQLGVRVDGNGYQQVALYEAGVRTEYKVHRLVAELYLDNPLGLPEVNHKDKDKLNNHSSNLEWCTSQENNEHDKAGHYSFLSPDGETVEVFNLQKFCRNRGLTNSNMHKVLTGERNHHKGWRLNV